MKCNVLVHKEIEIKPGDLVVLDDSEWWGLNGHHHIYVKRVVENRNGVYAVFTNNTWRPMSTHGITWEKVC